MEPEYGKRRHLPVAVPEYVRLVEEQELGHPGEEVQPGIPIIVSPGFALLIAAWRSPPAGTVMMPDGGGGGGGGGAAGTAVMAIVEMLNPPASNTSFITCGPARSVAGIITLV